jgi:hypothetical protein
MALALRCSRGADTRRRRGIGRGVGDDPELCVKGRETLGDNLGS